MSADPRQPPESFRPESRVDSIRVPPQSNQAEQAVLGSVMLAPATLWRVVSQLSEADFYRRDHRLIFRAILEVERSGREIDAISLGEWFERNGLEEQIGGTGYLVELASGTPSAANVEHYAAIVREKAMLRELITVGTEIVNDGFRPENRTVSEILGSAAQRVDSVVAREPMHAVTAGDVLDRVYRTVCDEAVREGDETGLMTGFADIDEATAGLQPEDFVILAARPGVGKTVLGMNIADKAAHRGKRVAVWSLEMSALQLGKRLAASRANVLHRRMKRPKQLDDGDWTALSTATKAARSLDFLILDAPDLTMDRFEAQVHQLHARKPLDLIVIDYIGLMTPPRAERHELAMGEISRRMKKLAKRVRVPILALHQLNRGLESRASKEPTMADLRDTGRFEQDADMIWLLHREKYYHPQADDDCQLHIAKQRSDETPRLGLGCELNYSRFVDYNGKWIPYGERKKQEATAEDGAQTRGYVSGKSKKSKPDGKKSAAGGDE